MDRKEATKAFAELREGAGSVEFKYKDSIITQRCIKCLSFVGIRDSVGDDKLFRALKKFQKAHSKC